MDIYNANSNNFKPTYLYIKTHRITGLKYFGKTTSKDPFKYKGSGKYWLNHLKKYGYEIDTVVIGYYIDEEECKKVALDFSITNNIVESKEWANLKLETLDGGFDHCHTPEKRELAKISINNTWSEKKQLILEKINQTYIEKYGITRSEYTKQQIPNIQQKAIQEKYGVNTPFSIPEIRQKIENTILTKYGKSNVLLVKEIQDKMDDIMVEKYGNVIPILNEEIRLKTISTNLEKYDVEFPLQSELIRNKGIETLMERYGVDRPMHIPEAVEKLKTTLKEIGHQQGVKNSNFGKCWIVNHSTKQNSKIYKKDYDEFILKNTEWTKGRKFSYENIKITIISKPMESSDEQTELNQGG